MATITCTTSAVSFTEGAATVDRDRIFTTSVEVVSFTEATAPINRTLHLNPASVEVIAFAENAAVIAIYEGTIDITMPVMTGVLAGLGGNLNYLWETATARESLGGNLDLSYTDIGIFSDLILTITTQYVTETATAGDTLAASGGPQLHDTATITQNYSVIWDANIHPRGWKRGTESFKLGLAETLTDGITGVDTIVHDIVALLQESGYARNVLTASASANQTTSSAATVEDSQVIGLGEALADIATLADLLTDSALPQAALVDVLSATDLLVGAQHHNALLEDVFTGTGLPSFGSSVLTTLVANAAAVREVLWAQDYLAIAWVLNTETYGLSTYDNFGFTSITAHDGVLYATSPNGVHSLTADNDAGRNIDAEITTGFLDFGAEQTKRMSDLYVGYTGGRLQCDVETYDGPQDVYNYQLEERDANAPRNNRLKIGRGLSSRYWRFSIKNLEGADFQLYDLTANVGRSNRRL